MAFSLCCRFAVFNSPPPHPLLNILPIPKPHNLFLPNCPPKSTKFTSLPLSLQNQYTLHSSTSSSSSMDSPPQGYRRNVGICLINPSKKYIYISNSLSLSLYLCMCSVYVCVGQVRFFFFWRQIFAASRLDIPNSWQMPQVIFFLFYIEVFEFYCF
jgi:hypothetical protein